MTKCSHKIRLQSISTKSLPGDVGLSETNGYTSIDRRLPHRSELNNSDQFYLSDIHSKEA